MLKRLLTVLAVVAALAPGAAAHAAMPTFAGQLCGFEATNATNPEWMEGHLYGGPLAVADLPLVLDGLDDVVSNPVSVTLDCVARVGAVTVATTSGSGPVVVVAPPRPFGYWPDSGEVEMCSAVTITYFGGSTEHYYWDYVARRFTTDPAAPCFVDSQACPPTIEGCGGADTIGEYVDLIVCPELALLFPPDGDLPAAVWDCPPYGDM